MKEEGFALQIRGTRGSRSVLRQIVGKRRFRAFYGFTFCPGKLPYFRDETPRHRRKVFH